VSASPSVSDPARWLAAKGNVRQLPTPTRNGLGACGEGREWWRRQGDCSFLVRRGTWLSTAAYESGIPTRNHATTDTNPAIPPEIRPVRPRAIGANRVVSWMKTTVSRPPGFTLALYVFTVLIVSG
jgi:hypothetical protein